jgi:hypothetical protein
VLLEAIRNILRNGQSRLDSTGNNPYLLRLEQAGGIDAIELLQVSLHLCSTQHLITENGFHFFKTRFSCSFTHHSLQHDKSQKVMRLAQDILENYIGIEEDGAEEGRMLYLSAAPLSQCVSLQYPQTSRLPAILHMAITTSMVTPACKLWQLP